LTGGPNATAATHLVCTTACRSACPECRQQSDKKCSLATSIKDRVQQLQEFLGVSGAQGGATVGALEVYFRRVFAESIGTDGEVSCVFIYVFIYLFIYVLFHAADCESRF
jgi:hypothetical protein